MHHRAVGALPARCRLRVPLRQGGGEELQAVAGEGDAVGAASPLVPPEGVGVHGTSAGKVAPPGGDAGVRLEVTEPAQARFGDGLELVSTVAVAREAGRSAELVVQDGRRLLRPSSSALAMLSA